MADANWSNRRLLLHFDGSNGSTTFVDSSDDARTVTAVGSAALTTSVLKWGTASLSLNGTTGNRASVSMPAFAGDFTVEAWVYLLAAGGSASRAVFTAPPFEMYRHSGGTFRLYREGFGVVITGSTMATDTWHHVALSRSGTNLRLFLNGALEGTITNSTTISSGTWYIGEYAPSGGEVWQGYIDDFRVSDRAEYTAAFTPPSAAFEDGAAPSIRIQGRSPLGQAELLARIQSTQVQGRSGLGSGAALVSSPGEVRVQGRSALGTASARLWRQDAVVQGRSPVGRASTLARIQSTQVQGRSALGTGAVRATIPQAARVQGRSALGSASVTAWHDFTGAVSETSTLAYEADFITPGGTVRIPVSSWQATLDTDGAGYVQCVVAACLEWIDTLVISTEFVIYRRATLTDGGSIEYEMARAQVGQRSYAQGPRNYSATISGYTDALTPDASPPTTFDRTLTGVRTVFDGDGGMRVTADIDWLLRPGMRAYYGSTEILVDYINFYVPGNDQYMIVGERA